MNLFGDYSIKESILVIGFIIFIILMFWFFAEDTPMVGYTRIKEILV